MLSFAAQIGGNQDHDNAYDEGHQKPCPPPRAQRFEQTEGNGECEKNYEEGERQGDLKAQELPRRPPRLLPIEAADIVRPRRSAAGPWSSKLPSEIVPPGLWTGLRVAPRLRTPKDGIRMRSRKPIPPSATTADIKCTHWTIVDIICDPTRVDSTRFPLARTSMKLLELTNWKLH